MQDSPDAKKPCKGILKTSSSFDKPSASYRKSAKFDEFNVLQTFHPPDKDYGHMKIDEPKTPYNYSDPKNDFTDQLDANLLAEKLRIAATTLTEYEEEVSEEDTHETESERAKRIEFEKRRKAHYNEFEVVRLARKLIQEEEDSEEDEKDDEAKEEADSEKNDGDSSTNADDSNAASAKGPGEKKMDIDNDTNAQSSNNV